MSITLEQVLEAAEIMRQCCVRPLVATTQEQADKMTEQDPFDYVWSAGEPYYVVIARP